MSRPYGSPEPDVAVINADSIESYAVVLAHKQEAIVLQRLRREMTPAEVEALQVLRQAENAVRLAADLIRLAERKAAEVLPQ